jgi:predicted CoA-substrate-specific enzyme activase
MIKQFHPSRIVATGYGRHLAAQHFASDAITEIKAHALGARHFFPRCRTVLDVGGQDAKAISLDEAGKVAQFQMNDKCAAGTGRFLEIMATSLCIPLAEFGSRALQGADEIKVTSMCAVFAESEVVSLKNQGASPRDIARAVHLSVAERLISMLHRVGFDESVVFTGGVARNIAVVELLREKLEIDVLVPEEPDIVGALGAALYVS